MDLVEPMARVMRMYQERLMADTCVIYREGVPVSWKRGGHETTTIPCRVGEQQTFAEPGDPHDANTRSMSEWAITLPHDVQLITSDRIVVSSGIDVIVGDDNRFQTNLLAVQAFSTKPKSATPWLSLVLYRDSNLDGISVPLPAQKVQIFYDHIVPQQTPARYIPAERSFYQTGVFRKAPPFDVQTGDTFAIGDLHGRVSFVLPSQPQEIEAHWMLDLSGGF